MSFEQDVVKIRDLIEADIFKPATPEIINQRKIEQDKAKQALIAKRRAIKEPCPHCKEDLKDVGVSSTESVRQTITREYEYDADRDQWIEGDISRDDDDYSSEDYTCGNCGEQIERDEDFDIVTESRVNEQEIFKAASPEDIANRPESLKKKKHRDFIIHHIDFIKEDILSKIDRFPDNWEGLELRQYIADAFAVPKYSWSRDRRTNYTNDTLVNNI